MKDPVCGMEIGEGISFKSSYKDKTYYFCSLPCKQRKETVSMERTSKYAHHVAREAQEYN